MEDRRQEPRVPGTGPPPPARTSGFRRRSQRTGAAVLLDEAAALFGTDPLRWTALGLLPSLPVAAIAFASLYLHRVTWIDRAWDLSLWAASLGVSVLLVLAWQFRATAQGRFARAVIEEVHPQAILSESGARRPGGWLSLACVAMLGTTATLLGVALLVLPGLALAGFLVPVPAIVAVEGRDTAAALSRAAGLPRGSTGKGMSSVVIFGGLAILAWLNVLLGTQALILLVRILTGAEVATLLRTFGFGNEVFVLGALLLALLLLEPLWGIQRSLVYLDARLGQSGTDLRERWSLLLRRPRPRTSASPSAGAGRHLFLLIALLASGATSAFAAGEPPPGPVAEAADYADEIDYIREILDAAIERYTTTGFEDLDVARSLIESGTWRDVRLPDGRVLRVDGRRLADDLPAWVHTEDTADQARRISGRLAEAVMALGQSDPRDGSRAPAEDAPRDLLQAELAQGGYDVAQAGGAGDEYRGTLQDRVRAWLEALVARLTARRSPQRPPVLPSFDGRIVMAAVAFILAILILVFFLSQGLRARIRAPEAEAREPEFGTDLPDARQRTPLGWRDHADRLADEGLFREAVRAIFLAVLARLDRTREIEYRRERTDGEHLRSFRGEPGRLAAFALSTSRFEVAWYGSGGASRADFEAMAAGSEQLLVGAAASAAPGAYLGVEVGHGA